MNRSIEQLTQLLLIYNVQLSRDILYLDINTSPHFSRYASSILIYDMVLTLAKWLSTTLTILLLHSCCSEVGAW